MPVIPRLGWYGDDFTGATDTLAALAKAGRRALLFLDVPDIARLGAAQRDAGGPLDAVGIAGAARKQLEENASRLAIDVWDRHARQYGQVPLEDREAFLQKAYADFVRMGETLSGNVSTKTDEELVAQGKRQAQRDIEWAKKNPQRMPDGEALGTVFAVMNNNVGAHATAEQKARGQQMMRDMMRLFRNQDISTGKPKGAG